MNLKPSLTLGTFLPTVLFALSNPLAAQSVQLSDFLALQPGTWNYGMVSIATPVANSTRTELTRILNVAEAAGGGAITNFTKLTDEGLISVRERSTLEDDFSDETQDTDFVILPSTLVVGAVTTDTSTYTGAGYVGTNTATTTVNGFENITVGGTNYSALKVTISVAWQDDEESGTDIDTLWLAEGIGIVRFRFEIEEFSATFDLTNSPSPPSSPADGTAIGMTGAVDLTWDSVSGIDDYLIHRGTTNNPETANFIGTIPQPTNGSEVTFTDSTVVGETPYFYFLQSRIGGAKSAFTSPISGMALPEMSFTSRLEDLGLTGDDALLGADPNNDGIDNGIAYALGIPLVGPVSSAERARLPQVGRPSENNRSTLKTILPNNVPDDVTLIVEINDELTEAGWTEIARKVGSGSWTGDSSTVQQDAEGDFTCVATEATQTITDMPTGFMRLRVELGN